jgi:hypothetical protein
MTMELTDQTCDSVDKKGYIRDKARLMCVTSNGCTFKCKKCLFCFEHWDDDREKQFLKWEGEQ